ncbi:hypothetical protein DFQ30_002281 [Apophysomyces sp. BC1015]|nr:hypothetical protein DFQ30_002281 [Apophysomyces sp. BC1015]
MQEQARVQSDTVVFDAAPPAGDWINRRGSDIGKDAVILPAGTRLTPQALGLAASVGCAVLPVARRPRVAIFFTGDELTMPGEPLREGAIYNSSRFTLGSLLAALGCDVTDLGIVPDRFDATRDALRRAALEHDLILTSGGVSVGDEDHVRAAVQAEGKPLAFGTVRRALGGESHDADTGTARDTAFFIGLPGNPVSSFVTFVLFVRPFILRLAGAARVEPQALRMRADFTQKKADRRNEFLRARINDGGGLDLFPNQSSAVLTSTVWADGLIDNPPGHPIQAGETVRFLPFSALLAVREAVGTAAETVDVPDGVATLGDVRTWLRSRGGAWADALADTRALRMACDHVMTGPSTQLTDGCEVAFFPPVTGG